MGMFDNIIVDVNILPDLTQEEKLLLNETKGWQTKDFENTLTDVYITKDETLNFKHSFVDKNFPYKLQIKESEWEEVPLDQRLHSDVSPIIALAGSIRETNIRIVDLNYTGTFVFYTNVDKNIGVGAKETIWYEFVGRAENGKIKSIKKADWENFN
jgi:hypothetical protein